MEIESTVILFIYCNSEVSRGAETQVIVNAVLCCVVRSVFARENEIFNFFFLRFGFEAIRGVELRHSTCNAFKIRRKVGNGVF